MGDFTPTGDLLDPTKYKRRPRYSIILHDVREEFGLSANTYLVIDSIHKLCTSDPRYPYCKESKDNIADFLKIGRRTVFRSIDEGEQIGLLEKDEYGGLRTTQKWRLKVETYSIRAK